LFYFDHEEHANGDETEEELRGLRLVSPGQATHQSINAAKTRCRNQLQHVNWQPFYNYVGVTVLEELSEDPLLGKRFIAEWITSNGNRNTIVGAITNVQFDQTCAIPEKEYKVRLIPECEIIVKHDLAWTGCLAHEAMMSPNNRGLAREAPFHFTWVVPRTYNRRMVAPRNGTQELPHVTIQHKIFELEFSVKPSNIPNAGFGVFLSCKSWGVSGDVPACFELPAGQLLDFGIYAPIRPEDKRDNYEFILKNFAHKFRCEDYSFKTIDEGESDTIFDITDDITGELHHDARMQVPPFVNEINSSSGIAQVHAKYDCEGALHYLLGHVGQDQGPFRLEVGKEIEILVDYGDSYENARIRQGYPRQKLDALDARQRLKQDELEYLEEVNTYTADEVKSMKRFFLGVLESKKNLEREVAGRMIFVLLLLMKRNKTILREFEGVDEDESVCDNGGRNTAQLLETYRGFKTLTSRFVAIWGTADELYAQLKQDEMYTDFMKIFFPREELESILGY
jgi:hypothetical protein